MKRVITALFSLIDPRNYLHLFKLVNYYRYSHVEPRRAITIGKDSAIAPNVSFRNGERITIGRGTHIGEHSYLWAGNDSGKIIIGDNVSLAPEVFITASDYQFKKGLTFRDQPKRERDVTIGNDVWLGTGVVITAGVNIADGCIVGAGAVVTKDLEENVIAVGVPARVVSVRK